MATMVRDFDWRRPASFMQVAMAAAFRPKRFFRQMDNPGDLLTPLIFLVMVHLLPTLAALITGVSLQAAGLGMVVRLLTDLIFIGLVYTVGHHFMRSPMNMGGFFRICAYALGIKLVAVIFPFLGGYQAALMLLVYVYIMVLLFFGMRYAAGLSFLMAVGCVMISVVGITLLMSLWGSFTVQRVPSI